MRPSPTPTRTATAAAAAAASPTSVVTAMPSCTAAVMARPSSRPSSSASKLRKPSPSRSPSPATAPKPKAAGSSTRRRSPLSDLNSRGASTAQQQIPLPRPPPEKQKRQRDRYCGFGSRPGARRPDRLPDQESRTRAQRRAGQEARRRGLEPIAGPIIKKTEPAAGQIKKTEPAAGKKHWPARQLDQFEALTPEKKEVSGATPSTGATPPILASISPEMAAACGSATPACFAAGHHVLAGVDDRRKCRPRGILAIAGEGFTSEDLDAEPSRASIHWLSSPSGAEAGTCSTKCGKEEASVNWLVSPRDEGAVDLLEDDIFVPRCSSEDAFWRFSPDCKGLLGSPLLGGLLDFGTPASDMSGTTPSSGFPPLQKTPSSGDSISPFSLIVKRASESSARLHSLCAQQGLGSSYHRDSAADPTPMSGESWPESVSSSTRSGLIRTGSRPIKMMDPMLECVEMMNLSPRPGDDDFDGNSALPAPLPELSFQFTGALMPLKSIDLSSFKGSPHDVELNGKETSFRKPVMTETRISWREGLVSRMFDIGDLDWCKWISDDEDSPVLSHNDEPLPDGTKLQPIGHRQGACGFGSVEFSCIGDELNNNSSMASPNPVSVAESMRAEGFELVSSDDSDWALFYKNALFELSDV
ncbi:unnamed protein product [Urochloa decumbens]|uniref:Uncharacterized protein n=1 Tax=Urochloa decumbens TaxID=240449 RepID=A0ABC8V7M1_9POAL